MYEAFREAPQSKKDRSRLKLGLWITLAAVLLALTATPLVWASRQSAAYRRYMDALNGSVLYAREHDGVWLERAGSRVHYPQLAGAGISEKLRQAGMGKRQQELPEGEGVTLDFGDGSLLRLWEVPIRGAIPLRRPSACSWLIPIPTERHTAMIPITWGGTGWWTACPLPGKAGRGIPGGDCAYTGTAPAGDALMGRRAA